MGSGCCWQDSDCKQLLGCNGTAFTHCDCENGFKCRKADFDDECEGKPLGYIVTGGYCYGAGLRYSACSFIPECPADPKGATCWQAQNQHHFPWFDFIFIITLIFVIALGIGACMSFM